LLLTNILFDIVRDGHGFWLCDGFFL